MNREQSLLRKRSTAWRWPPVRRLTFANVLRLMLGLWVLSTPLLSPELSGGDVAGQNQAIAGACVALLATMRIIFTREAGIVRGAHLLLGLWTMASPWLFDYVDSEIAFWNSTISGALIAVLATWSLVR